MLIHTYNGRHCNRLTHVCVLTYIHISCIKQTCMHTNNVFVQKWGVRLEKEDHHKNFIRGTEPQRVWAPSLAKADLLGAQDLVHANWEFWALSSLGAQTVHLGALWKVQHKAKTRADLSPVMFALEKANNKKNEWPQSTHQDVYMCVWVFMMQFN